MSSSQTVARQRVSRRTVTRGAAWSVPAVAVAVAAPAFAASNTNPVVTAGASCKCPGSGGNNFNFKAVLSVTTAGSADWKFHFTAFTFDGSVAALPADQTLTGGDGNLILVYNLTNSAAKHTVFVQMTATNLTTNATANLTFGPQELTFAPNCVSPILCP
jgi:uncharacterized Zn-binding protein involved in type VI secretion